MTNYNVLLSAEINSLDELKKNYLIDIDTLEKICACSVAYSISESQMGFSENIIDIGQDDEPGIYAIGVGAAQEKIIALEASYISSANRIPTSEMLKSIRTVSKHF